MSRRLVFVVASFPLLAAVAVIAGCGSDGRAMSPPGPDQTQSIVTTTTQPQAGTGSMAMGTAWNTGDPIPDKFACPEQSGQNIAPVVSWGLVPVGTTEMALVLTDTNSEPRDFVHWIIVGIPTTSNGIAEGGTIPGSTVLTNGAGVIGYSGPCPPAGMAHTYELTLYALTQANGLTVGVPAATALQTIRDRSHDQVTIIGTFTA